MANDDLKKKFEQAAEIAGSVPKELREAAFNRALDALLGPVTNPAAQKPPHRKTPAKSKKDSESHDVVAVLLRDLNRTGHPEVIAAPRVLERTLYVLRAAREDHEIDGLGASQIAKVLTDKFRITTSRRSVSRALDGAGGLVNRTKVSGAVIYRLMHPGDEYLEKGVFNIGRGNKKATKKVAMAKKKKKTAKKSAEKSGAGKKAPKSGRPGPGVMLKELAASGFFDQPRSIAVIQSHCQKQRAHNYALHDLSTPLRRAVHNGLLKRDQNEDGQYEYTAK